MNIAVNSNVKNLLGLDQRRPLMDANHQLSIIHILLHRILN